MPTTPTKKSKREKNQKVHPEGKTTHVLIRMEPPDSKQRYWNTKFGKLEDIKSYDAFCQLFKNPSTLKTLKVEDVRDAKERLENFKELIESECILHRACFANFDVFKVLFCDEVNPKLEDGYKQTPLHFAAYLNNEKMIRHLLKIKSEERKEYYNGNEETVEKLTPVHYAVCAESIQALEIFREYGCNMNAKDEKGQSPLALAIQYDNPAAAKLLLDWDVEIDHVTMLKLLYSFPNLAALTLGKKPCREFDANRGFYKYDFSLLIPEEKYVDSSHLPTSLAIVIKNQSTCIAETDTFQKYINLQWNEFGKIYAFIIFCLFFCQVLLWTCLGIFVDYKERQCFRFPKDIWRVIFLILGIGGNIIWIIMEYQQCKRSDLQTEIMKNFWLYEDGKTDYKIFPKYPTNHEAAQENKFNGLSYLHQKSNLIDVASIITQWVDFIVQIIIIFASTITYVHNYIVCINITLLWLALLKTLRPFTSTGTLVISLSKVVSKDLFRFSIVFMMFLLPMSFNFWMTFGKRGITDSHNVTTSVDHYDTFPEVFLSVLRMAVVDEYDYNNMKKIEPVFTEILITFWLAVSAILLVNLFIALLTNTFQRVYDNTTITITMEKAQYLMNAWHTMIKFQKILKFLASSKENTLRKIKQGYTTRIYSDENFANPAKFQEDLTHMKETFSVLQKDVQSLKEDMKKILKDDSTLINNRTQTETETSEI